MQIITVVLMMSCKANPPLLVSFFCNFCSLQLIFPSRGSFQVAPPPRFHAYTPPRESRAGLVRRFAKLFPRSLYNNQPAIRFSPSLLNCMHARSFDRECVYISKTLTPIIDLFCKSLLGLWLLFSRPCNKTQNIFNQFHYIFR